MVKKYTDKPCALVVKTKALLDKDERTLLELYEESGLPLYWLRSFKQGPGTGAQVNRVSFLYEFLSGEKLVK